MIAGRWCNGEHIISFVLLVVATTPAALLRLFGLHDQKHSQHSCLDAPRHRQEFDGLWKALLFQD